MSEKHIWQPIARRPEQVGFPGALALNHVQLGRAGGFADLILLPDPVARSGARLVLVEAKRAANSESSDRVIGQLLKYYARALRIGTKGLEGLRWYAQREADGIQREGPLISMRRVYGTKSQAEAHALLEQGDPLRPQDIRLIVALDEFRDKQARRLGFIVHTLQTHHGLPIEIWEVRDGSVRRCAVSGEDLYNAV